MKNKSIYHWLVALSCLLIMVGAIGIMINCTGIFYGPICDELKVGRGDIAMYTTICSLVGGFASPLVAKLMDKFMINLVMGAGLIVECIAYALMGLSQSVYMFYILGAFVGIGYCLCTSIPCAVIVSNWFEKLSGLVMGIVMSASGVGGAIFTTILSSCINSFGWRTTYLIGSIITLILGIPALLLIRLKPESKNLLPFGAVSAPIDISSKKVQDKSSLMSPALIFLCICFTLAAAITSLTSHYPGYAAEIGASASTGALMLTSIMIGNITAKLLFGAVSDILGPIKTLLIWNCITAAVLITFTFTTIHSKAILLVLAFLFGSAYAGAPVAMPLIIRKIWGFEKYSRVLSIANIFTNCGFAAYVAVIGYIYDFTGTYRIAIFSVFCLLVISTVLLFLTVSAGKKVAK